MGGGMRDGKKRGFPELFVRSVVDVVVEEMGDAYPELRRNRDSIVQVVRSEEERFDAVLTAGLPRLEEALDRAAAGSRVLSGEDAFRLYDSLGEDAFRLSDSLGGPLDFMEDIARQRALPSHPPRYQP